MIDSSSNDAIFLCEGETPVPEYRLQKRLGSGTVGEVWSAVGPGNVLVALKFVDLGEFGGVTEWNAIQRIKKIRHANLLPIIAIWVINENGVAVSDEDLQQAAINQLGIPADLDSTLCVSNRPRYLVIATPLAEKTLEQRLQECLPNGIDIEELCGYMKDVARAIDYLNEPARDLGEGSVAMQHCDIKPSNIVIVGDSAQVLDYGVVYILNDDTQASALGSPAYMAPEICSRGRPSPRSDQYSLAITYTELRTGRLPFRSRSVEGVISAHREGALDLSGLSAKETSIIRRATSRDPKQRFNSSSEMVGLLCRAVRRGDLNAPKRTPSQVDLDAVCNETVERDGTATNWHLESLKWYRRAAEQGETKAQVEVAHIYYFGRGVPRDFHEAAYWYRKAAMRGNTVAQNNLATCYCLGRGVEKDPQQAEHWLILAAEKGYVRAQLNLAQLYANRAKPTGSKKSNGPHVAGPCDSEMNSAEVLSFDESQEHTIVAGIGSPSNAAKAY